MVTVLSISLAFGWTLTSYNYTTGVEGSRIPVSMENRSGGSITFSYSTFQAYIVDRVLGDESTLPPWSAPFTPIHDSTVRWSIPGGSHIIPDGKLYRYRTSFLYDSGYEEWQPQISTPQSYGRGMYKEHETFNAFETVSLSAGAGSGGGTSD
jgi:hypothetical protein